SVANRVRSHHFRRYSPQHNQAPAPAKYPSLLSQSPPPAPLRNRPQHFSPAPGFESVLQPLAPRSLLSRRPPETSAHPSQLPRSVCDNSARYTRSSTEQQGPVSF